MTISVRQMTNKMSFALLFCLIDTDGPPGACKTLLLGKMNVIWSLDGSPKLYQRIPDITGFCLYEPCRVRLTKDSCCKRRCLSPSHKLLKDTSLNCIYQGGAEKNCLDAKACLDVMDISSNLGKFGTLVSNKDLVIGLLLLKSDWRVRRGFGAEIPYPGIPQYFLLAVRDLNRQPLLPEVCFWHTMELSAEKVYSAAQQFQQACPDDPAETMRQLSP
ncbi:hypothetical protein CPB84DRAFT_1747568 [Gymnopilus junonius]|uniref:Uncharacterized protein n=1 Tax=Gymnopilus junonius TaxID=109634 RepID=A0A9P5TLZ9_GYMJU|nr:hypothetical protein CPB84DRAFT_1747568 [Gymnopilus junonius]